MREAYENERKLKAPLIPNTSPFSQIPGNAYDLVLPTVLV
jgi:hypothetical protein